MLLYHYTCRLCLPAIRQFGLSKGDVPLTAWTGTNAVWLTTDLSPYGHGLGEEDGEVEASVGQQAALIKMLSPAQRETLPTEILSGQKKVILPNKKEVRITVRIPSNDRALKRWLPWARRRIEPQWLQTLHSTAGGERKARTWYLCFRTIAPAEFVRVEVLDSPSDEQICAPEQSASAMPSKS